jgi:methionine biosynthesis protein MetW
MQSNTSDTPDNNASGFLTVTPNSLRYDYKSIDPDDVAMKIAKHIDAESRVLDVGCGTGVVSEIIKAVTNATITGIEPDATRVKAALARGLDVKLGLLDMDFVAKHGLFDYIVFADVLEHLENPAALVKVATKALKPGGAIIASVPNVAHWFVRVDLLRGRFDYQDCGIMDATHLRWFTKKTITSFFTSQGFRVDAVDYTVNIALPDYIHRLPWRWIPFSLKKTIVKLLSMVFPELFGCQFIVKATLL